ncbi:hypothetical protein GCM10010260_26200 [Streptomyces filipinensis]|uniref:Uncharacterized protein n=1 Tax=Streptomyces filipinensis TaxID=66887 RepID=A0A918M9X6_9ACTN|nr:hypothetical protein [Streptomyces filipinensis]GGU90482.1 hypothetical protein GCM10010260_26200 [Streptomyces filipinensis]
MPLPSRLADRPAADGAAARGRGLPGTPVRAALALGLLIGFYLLALLVLAAPAVRGPTRKDPV